MGWTSERTRSEQEKWAEKNNLITVPMIEEKGEASNIKNYDNVVFGTLAQPSPEKIINDGMENVFVNGLPNEPISNKIIPNRIENHTNAELQKIEHPDFSYIKIETNSYISNPN